MKRFEMAIWGIFAFSLIMIMGASHAVADNLPESEIVIRSVYQRPHQADETWRVVPVRSSDNGKSLNFYRQDGQLVCSLRISTDYLKWEGVGKPAMSVPVQEIMIFPGYPVPCNYLTPALMNPSMNKFLQTKVAGGKSFKSTYRIDRESVSLRQAIENGWIHPSLDIKSGSLVRLNVMDKANRCVIWQVWLQNASWWVYEETLFRKSWVIDSNGLP